MSLIHGRSPNGASVAGTNPVIVGGENAAGNADTWTVESGAGLVGMADGGSATLGSKADAAATVADATPFSSIALLKGIFNKLLGVLTVEVSGSILLKGAVATVLAAGTRVQLPDFPCQEVTVIALRANLGYIYAGGNDVSSAVYGVSMTSEQSFTFFVSNANMIYIDASVSGEGISYVAV